MGWVGTGDAVDWGGVGLSLGSVGVMDALYAAEHCSTHPMTGHAA